MNPTCSHLRAAAVAAAAAVFALAPAAPAQLFVYEPFDYAVDSDVLGAGGGVGFSGAWREHAAGSVPAGSFTVGSGSLAAPAGLMTLGNHAILTGEFGTLQPARDFPNIAGADGTTTWISYIGQRMGPEQNPATTSPPNMWPRGVNVGVFDTEVLANPERSERIGIGNSSNATENEWSIIPEGSGGLRVGSAVPFTDLHWAVLRIDHHGDHTVADDAYLFLDPDPAVEPLVGDAVASVIGGLDYSNIDFTRPFVGNESSDRPYGVLAMDEFRIGGDYASMSAVPEPSAALLVVLAGLGLCARRGRR